jgi:transketolase
MAEITQKQDNRREFINTLVELAEKDDKIVLIVPDVGFNYMGDFQEKFPERFFNLGTTEQSAMVIASAMALAGLKPYIYSMINFVIFRPYEQLRNAVCMHNANVKIIGVKGSEKYKFLGFSHNLIFEDEDIKALENLPDMTAYVAKNAEDTRKIILETYESQKPCYIRV